MNKSAAPRTILVRNAQRKLPVDVRDLQAFAALAWQEALRKAARGIADLSAVENIDIILVSDRRMADLHKRFMGIEGATDVITFQHGEIVISVETTAEQALDHNSSLGTELRLYIVHGMLHLLGFDDTTPTAATLMERTQSEIVAAVAGQLS